MLEIIVIDIYKFFVCSNTEEDLSSDNMECYLNIIFNVPTITELVVFLLRVSLIPQLTKYECQTLKKVIRVLTPAVIFIAIFDFRQKFDINIYSTFFIKISRT